MPAGRAGQALHGQTARRLDRQALFRPPQHDAHERQTGRPLKCQLDRPLLTGNDRPVVVKRHVEAAGRPIGSSSLWTSDAATGGQPQAVLVGEMRLGDQLGLARDRPPRRVEGLEVINQHSRLAVDAARSPARPAAA